MYPLCFFASNLYWLIFFISLFVMFGDLICLLDVWFIDCSLWMLFFSFFVVVEICQFEWFVNVQDIAMCVFWTKVNNVLFFLWCCFLYFLWYHWFFVVVVLPYLSTTHKWVKKFEIEIFLKKECGVITN